MAEDWLTTLQNHDNNSQEWKNFEKSLSKTPFKPTIFSQKQPKFSYFQPKFRAPEKFEKKNCALPILAMIGNRGRQP